MTRPSATNLVSAGIELPERVGIDQPRHRCSEYPWFQLHRAGVGLSSNNCPASS